MELRPYIGIPFADKGRERSGCDCWGLCLLVYREQLGIIMPSLDELYTHALHRREVGKTVAAAMSQGWGMDVTDNAPEMFDVLVFRRGGIEDHVGLWAGPGLMLHVLKGSDSGLERFDTSKWQSMFSRRLRHGTRC